MIGGAGAWGKVTEKLFRDLGFDVIVTDICGSEDETLRSNILAIQRSRIVFFSVLPIEEIAKIITEAGNAITPEHVILDNASVKSPFLHLLRDCADRGCSVCSTHPNCRPDKPLEGKDALIMEVGSNSEEARSIADRLFQSAGMVIKPISINEHDQIMIPNQGWIHWIKRAESLTLVRTGVDINRLRHFGTVNSQLADNSRKNTIEQEAEMSFTLINSMLSSPEGVKLAEAHIEDLQMIVRLVKEKNKEEVKRLFDESAKFLKGGE